MSGSSDSPTGEEPPAGYYDRFSKVSSVSYDEEFARRVWVATEEVAGVRIMDNGK